VKLRRDGKVLQIDWLGKQVAPVLWFSFSANEGRKRVGLEYYLQARGSQPNSVGVDAWNEASERHAVCAEAFEQLFEQWSRETTPQSRLFVASVRFNGKKRNWQGGGVEDAAGRSLASATPEQALAFLREYRDELWRSPTVACMRELGRAAAEVRKPDVSWLLPFDPRELARCRGDAPALHEFLRHALDSTSRTSGT
jgi:hypothetical protein